MTAADIRDERAFDRLRSDSAFTALAATFAPAPKPGTGEN